MVSPILHFHHWVFQSHSSQNQTCRKWNGNFHNQRCNCKKVHCRNRCWAGLTDMEGLAKGQETLECYRLGWMFPSRFPCQWCPSLGPEAASLVTQTSTGSRWVPWKFFLCDCGKAESCFCLVVNNEHPRYIIAVWSSPGSQLLHPSQDSDLDVERGGCRGQICTFYASAVKPYPYTNEVLAIERRDVITSACETVQCTGIRLLKSIARLDTD